MTEEETLGTQLSRALGEALESLEWCRDHIQEREVSARLQRVLITLGSLSLAIDNDMDGKADQAEAALRQGDWHRKPPPWGWHDALDFYLH